VGHGARQVLFCAVKWTTGVTRKNSAMLWLRLYCFVLLTSVELQVRANSAFVKCEALLPPHPMRELRWNVLPECEGCERARLRSEKESRALRIFLLHLACFGRPECNETAFFSPPRSTASSNAAAVLSDVAILPHSLVLGLDWANLGSADQTLNDAVLERARVRLGSVSCSNVRRSFTARLWQSSMQTGTMKRSTSAKRPTLPATRYQTLPNSSSKVLACSDCPDRPVAYQAGDFPKKACCKPKAHQLQTIVCLYAFTRLYCPNSGKICSSVKTPVIFYFVLDLPARQAFLTSAIKCSVKLECSFISIS